MSAVNAFLKDFLEMRKSLTPPTKIVGNPQPANPETKRRKKQFKQEQETDGVTLMTIIEKKPHKREVIRFLQNKSNQYTIEKMS